MIRKHILSALAFGLGLILLLGGLSLLLAPKDEAQRLWVSGKAAYGVLNEPPDTIDVLFIGDSETYNAFMPMKMWRDHGFTGYVCAGSGQRLCWTETYLKRILEVQRPLLVVLETDAIYAPVRWGDELSSDIQGALRVFRDHDRWKAVLGAPSRPDSYADDYKGYRWNPKTKGTVDDDRRMATDAVAPIAAQNAAHVAAMAAYCRERGASLVLVSTPSTKNWNGARHNGIAALSAQLRLDYIDLNCLPQDVAIDWQLDTRDSGDHLNNLGAAKVTAYIGKRLAADYALPDHREDPAYADWNAALERVRADHDL